MDTETLVDLKQIDQDKIGLSLRQGMPQTCNTTVDQNMSFEPSSKLCRCVQTIGSIRCKEPLIYLCLKLVL